MYTIPEYLPTHNLEWALYQVGKVFTSGRLWRIQGIQIYFVGWSCVYHVSEAWRILVIGLLASWRGPRRAAVVFEPTREANVRSRFHRTGLSAAEWSCSDQQTSDMEIADQWRREWAGTAEYGKVSFYQSWFIRCNLYITYKQVCNEAFLPCKKLSWYL